MTLQTVLDEAMASAATRKQSGELVGRAKINIPGDENPRPIGYWDPDWAQHGDGSTIGRLRNVFGSALAIAQRHEETRNAVTMAKIQNKPDPSLSLKHEAELLDREMKQIDTMRSTIATEIAELETRRGKLVIMEIDKGDAAAATVRAQIRQHLLSLKPADRNLFVRGADDIAAAAILEAPAYASGLTDIQRQNFKEQRLRQKYPDLVKFIDDGLEAARLTKRAVEAAFASAGARYMPILSAEMHQSTIKPGRAWA